MGAKDNYWRDEGITFAADDEEDAEGMQWFQVRLLRVVARRTRC